MRELEWKELEEKLKKIKFEGIKEEEIREKGENFKRKIQEHSQFLLGKRRSLEIKRKILVSSLAVLFIALFVASFPLIHFVQTVQAKSEALEIVRGIYKVEPLKVEVDLKNRSADVYFYDAKAVVDLKEERIVKVIPALKAEISEYEKLRALGIAKESPILKNFAYSEGGEVKVVDLSRAKLKAEGFEGYTFEASGSEELKVAKIKLSSEILPQDLRIYLIVDLKKGTVIDAFSSFNKDVEDVPVQIIFRAPLDR